jgi:hypothetical protein
MKIPSGATLEREYGQTEHHHISSFERNHCKD